MLPFLTYWPRIPVLCYRFPGMRLFRVVPQIVLALSFLCTAVSACPKIDRLVDYNCDQQIKIVFTGDSIVKGVRDTKVATTLDSGSGYPGRLQKTFPDATIINIGLPGRSTRQLLSAFKRDLTDGPLDRSFNRSRNADYFFIAIGTNDWLSGRPDLTVRNIVKLVSYLTTTLRTLDGTTPLFLVSTITPNVRVGNAEYATAVNSLLLAAQRRGQLPVHVRLDGMPRKLLDSDGLHPDPKGYDFLARVIKTFITGNLQSMARAGRKDEDNDGLYDNLERLRFNTSRYLTDSDGDGLSDGEEVFITFTNPLIPEATPTPVPSPEPTATPTPEPSATPTPTPTPTF